MKSYKFLLTVFSILFLTIAINAGENPAKEDKGDIEQTISSFVKSIDTQNANDLSKAILSNGAVVTLNSITNKMDNLTASQLVDRVKNHQQGGWARNVTVSSVDVDGNTAMAKVEITDARLSQSGFVTLVKENGTWKVASEVTTLALKK